MKVMIMSCHWTRSNLLIPLKAFQIILILLVTVDMAKANSSYGEDTLAITSHFSFHNNELMNLHHFLFEQASAQQAKHLLQDGVRLTIAEDRLAIARFTTTEMKVYDMAIAFYTEKIIDRELLHSGNMLKWLQMQPTEGLITDTTYTPAFTEILNQVKPIYSKHFWSKHKAANQDLLFQYIQLIEETEDFVIQKMESLSGSTWDQIVRVDLTRYGNWAGAYSPADDNIIVSSVDPEFHSSLYIEFVFHESSHLLFLKSSPFRKAMSSAYKTLGVKPSRNLWHAAMFYLCGLATRDALLKHDIYHMQIMEAKDVFKTYYAHESFRNILDMYYLRETALPLTAESLIQLRIE